MIRVLVVDDSKLVQALMRNALARGGRMQLSFASNGIEAMEHIQTHGEPDILFLDVNMPVMDGLEFLSRVSETGLPRRVPVVMISTEGHDDDVKRGLDAGAREYIKKPFDPAAVTAVVGRLTAQTA